MKSLIKRASVFSPPETISKGDDIKIKRIVSPFFYSFTPLFCFHCPPVSISLPVSWLESGVKIK